MSVSQRCLLGQSRLRTLEEPPAVRHSAENAGNENGIIYQTEAEECLVLLAEIDIHSRIECVTGLIQLRRIREIGK